MPIYDYVCANCGERVEVMHAVHAPGPTNCAACGGPLRKALSPPAIVFKGSGWAKKDARKASSSSSANSSKDEPTPKPEAGSKEQGGSSAAKEATGAAKD